MNKINHYLLLFILTMLADPSWAQQGVKLMSYNIRIASPPSKGWGVTEIDSIAAVINRSKPDLVALQEVDVKTVRSGKALDQAQKLAELTGMYAVFAKAVDRSEGDYGVAVLSKWPIIHQKSFRIYSPDSTVNENRALAVVEVKRNGKKFVFASFHLDHLNDEVRDFQLQQIFKHLTPYRKKAILMGADLNMSRESSLFSKIEENGFLIMDTNRSSLTFPNDKPRVTLDYFLYNSAFKKMCKDMHFEVLTQENYASDHLPIVLDFKF